MFGNQSLFEYIFKQKIYLKIRTDLSNWFRRDVVHKTHFQDWKWNLLVGDFLSKYNIICILNLLIIQGIK
jgi:hypothetical protein